MTNRPAGMLETGTRKCAVLRWGGARLVWRAACVRTGGRLLGGGEKSPRYSAWTRNRFNQILQDLFRGIGHCTDNMVTNEPSGELVVPRPGAHYGVTRLEPLSDLGEVCQLALSEYDD
jgi:hypothetical protein